jgi:hypothetical protein
MAPGSVAASPYWLVGREGLGPTNGEGTWLIERPMGKGNPVRIRVHGRREKAQAEVDRLNALAARDESGQS